MPRLLSLSFSPLAPPLPLTYTYFIYSLDPIFVASSVYIYIYYLRALHPSRNWEISCSFGLRVRFFRCCCCRRCSGFFPLRARRKRTSEWPAGWLGLKKFREGKFHCWRKCASSLFLYIAPLCPRRRLGNFCTFLRLNVPREREEITVVKNELISILPYIYRY